MRENASVSDDKDDRREQLRTAQDIAELSSSSSGRTTTRTTTTSWYSQNRRRTNDLTNQQPQSCCQTRVDINSLPSIWNAATGYECRNLKPSPKSLLKKLKAEATETTTATTNPPRSNLAFGAASAAKEAIAMAMPGKSSVLFLSPIPFDIQQRMGFQNI